MRNKLLLIVAFAIFCGSCEPNYLLAKPGSSAGRNSSSRGFSSGSKPSSTWGSSSKSSSSGWGSKTGSLKSSSAKPTVDSATYSRAKANGTVFTSKEAAASAFKSKNASKFPSKFASEPKSRPDYIPQSTTSGGKTYNITYNSGYGGYGYTNSLGAFIMYDAMSDAMMMNSLMTRNNYVYGPAPGMSGFGVFILTVFIFIVILGVIILIMKVCEDV